NCNDPAIIVSKLVDQGLWRIDYVHSRALHGLSSGGNAVRIRSIMNQLVKSSASSPENGFWKVLHKNYKSSTKSTIGLEEYTKSVKSYISSSDNLTMGKKLRTLYTKVGKKSVVDIILEVSKVL
ncbi:MAG: hypothetical protein ACE5FH_10785, partial [Candidatus Zixiibacteriota bacterium]